MHFAKCFLTATHEKTWLDQCLEVPSALIRYGVLLPLRLTTLTASTVAFFTTLPIALFLEKKDMVSTLVKYYCKGILFSLGVVPAYHGEKPTLQEPHVFVANHTSYLDYIVISAHQFPGAVVMARHKGALGFLQNNGLNYLNSMTFDRSDPTERQHLSLRLREHVMNPTTWPNPMIIFPEGTCVNNRYTIRFQKGAFELGVKVCPVGLCYNADWGSPYWDTRKGFLYYAFYRMTRWITPIDVTYCDPQTPRKDELPSQFGDRVKAVISHVIGVHSVDFNGRAKSRLLAVTGI
ncbi:acyltransferase-domain-containing protein [Hesseltinella vesiculosa]|uniref:Acyltransferase-domain-containing protein n=1 Tax=Hesseltinella vesiculosa TaxID=101127 RepID=A0A1X2GRW7_9FUNG|nr:acyltransferase-domain-containing protein [Hesseltinella vesiculosa]